MAYSNDTLNDIYDKTDGCCSFCGKKLSFVQYDRAGESGAWEVYRRRHTTKESGGSRDPLADLLPVCVICSLRRVGIRRR